MEARYFFRSHTMIALGTFELQKLRMNHERSAHRYQSSVEMSSSLRRKESCWSRVCEQQKLLWYLLLSQPKKRANALTQAQTYCWAPIGWTSRRSMQQFYTSAPVVVPVDMKGSSTTLSVGFVFPLLCVCVASHEKFILLLYTLLCDPAKELWAFVICLFILRNFNA